MIGSKQFIGKVVYDNVGVADNLPLAAAFARGPWRSWSSTSCSPGARVPSSRCDAVEAHALAPARGDCAHPRVPLAAAGGHRDLRVQLASDPVLADRRRDPLVDQPGLPVLGSLAALAVARHRFFGREAVSFLVVVPIALPGIVTGMALTATFGQVLTPVGIQFGLFTVIVGHATFCIVVIYNNVIARLRRVSGSFEEASVVLGADTWQTFRLITLPALRSAMVAGALLAFARALLRVGSGRRRDDARAGESGHRGSSTAHLECARS